ncbi:helix-turn-helix domain-containing protein [Fuerstiella marisgermanici]|uniref:Helix-turn-helix domain-containing protein n=1 Tax=Fuerstiella marisgermanici TaxID=1891926 RepID=A0A1P8WDM5_9PLAN|nr:helix-turn-helix domain-containing protein [Fuerstiella marisgermanici]APZ92175.1 hypothetical protein Fuma_01783 [Fuerstiella marisgermanici]
MTDHTVTQLSELMQRSRSSITTLIESGKLEAYDAAPDGRYRQYRVTPEALEKFRAANKAAKSKQPKQRRVAKPVKRYV